MNNKEIWKDIPGYEGYYQVSNLGVVKSLDRIIIKSNGVKLRIKESTLKSVPDNKGYLHVSLWKGNKRKGGKIHKLVAMAFLNHVPCGFKLVVDHINNDKLDNRVENLQIISNRENTSKNTINKYSNFTGVTFDKFNKKWCSRIRINGKRKHLGSFSNEYDAHLAYQKALSKL